MIGDDLRESDPDEIRAQQRAEIRARIPDPLSIDEVAAALGLTRERRLIRALYYALHYDPPPELAAREPFDETRLPIG